MVKEAIETVEVFEADTRGRLTARGTELILEEFLN